MKKILVIGAGFAGLSSLKVLVKSRKKLGLEITLVSSKKYSGFQPMFPDCIGRGVAPGHLTCDFSSFSHKLGVNFIQGNVLSVDLINKKARTEISELSYDFLLIASGSETNFYGNAQIKEHSFKLDDIDDIYNILKELKKNNRSNYIIAGGGYTGIEVAVNIRRYLKCSGKNKKVVVIERAPSILGPLPDWMKAYVIDNLKRLSIDIITDSGVSSIDENRIILTNGREFNDSMLIWAAGVRSADFIQGIKVDKNPQGRIKVDSYLRVSESCFVAGDAACFTHLDNPLRMAVQFGIKEGLCAAENIVRSINGEKLINYKPVDLGYVIPMANNRSCGVILGIKMKGLLPTFMHYLMCIYRSRSLGNQTGVLLDLIKSFLRK